MDTLPGGHLVARMLKAEGVGTVFTLSGLHIAPIYAGCVDEGIRLLRSEFGIDEDEEDSPFGGGAGAFAEQVNRP